MKLEALGISSGHFARASGGEGHALAAVGTRAVLADKAKAAPSERIPVNGRLCASRLQESVGFKRIAVLKATCFHSRHTFQQAVALT